MSISKFNHEGYYDPTPYGAFKTIEKEEKRKARFRPIVYICAPHSDSDQRSIEITQRYCRFAVDRGYLPIAPHLYFSQFIDCKNLRDKNTVISMSNILMKKCAEVWVFGERLSKQMEAEIKRAEETQRPVRYFTKRCQEVH